MFLSGLSLDIIQTCFTVFFIGVCGGFFFSFVCWAFRSVFDIFHHLTK